jgi:ABC-2 type transport system ATP-binding protein
MIRIENVSKSIKQKMVLEDINLCLMDGKTYGLKGINGSGKTMLMRIISGLIYPTEGKVYIDEKQLGKDISFPKNMGLLLENPSFLDSYTGFDNLKMLASLNDFISDDEIKISLKRVGLDPEDKRKYRKYSLGMKQRLGIAAAIMEKPKILILDEPLNALDTDGVRLFTEIIKEEKERGALIILACHEEEKLREYADVLIAMENGRIIDCQGEML